MSHNFTPFLDTNPNTPPEARYKALAGVTGGLRAWISADAIHWKLLQEQDKRVITDGNFDSQNLAFWNPVQKKYYAYHRKSRDKVRDIMFSTSTDFKKWTAPTFLEYGDSPREHLYTNAIRPYDRAPHLLIGLPTRFQPKTSQVEPVLMTSRDGLHFKRWSEELIPITAPSQRDGNRSNYMVNALLQLPGTPDQLSLYATEAYYKGPGSRVRRFHLRTDGFVSVHSGQTTGQSAGEILTKPFTFAGNQLRLNYATSQQGQIRIEIQDRSGKPIPGFELKHCQPLVGDRIDQVVAWSRSTSQAANQDDAAAWSMLENKPVRLRIEIKDADIYSLQFTR